MTKDEAIAFFGELYMGTHHIPSGGVHPYGGTISAKYQGWNVNHYGDLSTFDFDMLTRLVFLAHDRCVRATVEHSGPRMVKIVIWQRKERSGSFSEMHPTIETALATWRRYHSAEEAHV